MRTSTPKRADRPPLHQSVAETLRRDVLSQLTAGVKLESEAQLARRLGVSLATLRPALSVLAYEGLIERRHGSGTYATGHSPPQRIVALGMTTEAGTQSSSFAVRLFFRLSELFIRQGYRCRSYMVPAGRLAGWSELAEEVVHGHIAGAVIVATNPDALSIPFAEKGVPCIGPGSREIAGNVTLDYEGFVRSGLEHLLARGCRRIAMMQWNESSLLGATDRSTHDLVRAVLSEQGLPLHEEWYRWAVNPNLRGAGWEQFRDIWQSRAEKPDGILVTDDVLFRDVALGILDSQIKVPQQLQAVVHANKGSGLSYPFPVSLLEVDVDQWAELTANTLIKLMNRQPVNPRAQSIAARLVPAETRPNERSPGLTSLAKTADVVEK